MTVEQEQCGERARVRAGGAVHEFAGRWVEGGAWDRFGRYDRWVAVHEDGTAVEMPAHAGELVPGSTEDVVAYLHEQRGRWRRPSAPLTLELDPTYACASRDCGTRCFSAAYRRLDPRAAIPGEMLHRIVAEFAARGGKIVRFDGGGDPLLHPEVRNGAMTRAAQAAGLKSTILTSGDLLPSTDLTALAESGCYVRVSVNAATEAVRQEFHGNRVPLREILAAVERLASAVQQAGTGVPIGATYLLDVVNAHEIHASALRCREAGINHFSVRRVLGPEALRPQFTVEEQQEVEEQLARVQALNTDGFRVFVPWRVPGEVDLSPARGDFTAVRCWQSTFKTVVEPRQGAEGCRVQLCGRYRGGGIGQAMRLPAVMELAPDEHWVDR